MTQIFLHDGSQWGSKRVNSHHILVIGYGAGTYQNREVYQELRDQGYDLDIVSAGASSDVYPDDWQLGNPDSLDARGNPSRDLAGFAHTVCDHIRARPPSLIICGSRGSQVTIGVVLKTCWRGPFIALNAGCMTSRIRMPLQAYPCFVTFGQDYFPTKDPRFTNEQYQGLGFANRRALLVHLPNEKHMPRSEPLKHVLGICVALAQARATAREVQEILWPDQRMTIWQLKKGEPMRELWKYD